MVFPVDGVSPLRTAAPTRKASKAERAAGASFAHTFDASTDAAQATTATNPLTGIAPLFSAQEVDDALARASKGKARAEDMLRLLDEIRLGLLTGALSVDSLHRLSQSLAAHRPTLDDPRLTTLLDEVDLRARVELAKWTLRR